jgi:hypothetical protein
MRLLPFDVVRNPLSASALDGLGKRQFVEVVEILVVGGYHSIARLQAL